MRWNYTDPDLLVLVDFPYPMDQTVVPGPGNFLIDVDGVPKVPSATSWDSAQVLELDYGEALLGPTVVKAQFPIMHADLRSVGQFQTQPFDITGVEF